MFIPFGTQVASAAAAGLVAHWGYFVHGELDLQAASIARVHLLATIVLPYLKCQIEELSARQAVWESFILDGVYVAALLTSIVVYRLFLSPLRNVPGPVAMRISKLAHVWANMDFTHPNCKMLDELRTEYGDVVRTG
jgi:cytochrome P450 family 628